MSYTRLPTLGQFLDQSTGLERVKQERRTTSWTTFATLGSVGTGNTIPRTEFTDMVFEPVPLLYSVLSYVFMWTMLAGFLVLPTTFPYIEMILKNSELGKELHSARNIPVYVPSFPLVPLFKKAPPALYSL
jgi:hypothetical protein